MNIIFYRLVKRIFKMYYCIKQQNNNFGVKFY